MSFCPKCGSEKGPFLQGFCQQCYLEDHELLIVPESIEVDQCSKCDMIRVAGKFVEQSDEQFADFFHKKVKIKELVEPFMHVELIKKSHGETDVVITVTGLLDGKKVEVKAYSILRLRRICCPSCGKLSSGYFETKFQLRHSGERDIDKETIAYNEIKKALKELEKTDPLARITKEEFRPTGMDIYVASGKAARVALSRARKKIHMDVTPSKKLTGYNPSGKNRFQFTYSVRL